MYSAGEEGVDLTLEVQIPPHPSPIPPPPPTYGKPFASNALPPGTGNDHMPGDGDEC